MEQTPDKSHDARNRRADAARLLEESVVKLTAKVQTIIDRLAELKPDDPADAALIDKLDRLATILGRLRDQVLAREWSARLAGAILRSPSILGNVNGSPQLKRVAGWAQKTSKETQLDGRTLTARMAKEAVRALGAMASEKSAEELGT